MKRKDPMDIINNIYTHKLYGYKYQVIEHVAYNEKGLYNTYRIKFLDTNHTKVCRRHDIMQGICVDKSIKSPKPSVGYINTNAKGQKFKIIEKVDNSCYKIQFIESGNEYEVSSSNVRYGHVSDVKEDIKQLQSEIRTNCYGDEFKIIHRERVHRKNSKGLMVGKTMYTVQFIRSGYIAKGSNLHVISDGTFNRLRGGYTCDRSLFVNEKLYNKWYKLIRICKTTKFEMCERWKHYNNFQEDIISNNLLDDVLIFNINIYPDELEYNINTIYIKGKYEPKKGEIYNDSIKCRIAK